MIVDASAVLAILKQERGAAALSQAIEESSDCRMSVVNFVEAAIVLDRDPDPVVGKRLDLFRERAVISLIPVDEAQARIAREAYRDFGKGSGHPAQLNFGDCFAYALARQTGEPLLFKGNDFSRTDLVSAIEQ
ncbi:MAG TPA: type II toxin-antitoxin system VapC family toxin [Candidatus Binataceae bacterium]|nr:type II toxin-antitoxin system VapC family toxin [Candidatus Binataceae bacterium]